MKWSIFIVLIVMMFIVGCAKKEPDNITYGENQISGEDEGYINISAEKAKEMIDKGEYGVILDVRSLEEYNEGHIEDAILLPVSEIKEKVEAIIPDKDEVILLYCRSGRRSAAAAKDLIEMGYDNVYDFGGIIDWPYEIVKD